MANNDFFTDDQKEEAEKIKLGDQEFSADELSDLIGAGKKLKDLEEKQGQPIEDVLSSWGKRGEVIGDQKKRLEEAERELERLKNPPAKEVIDQENVKKEVLNELKDFGVMTKDEVQEMINNIYRTNRDGERLLAQVKRVSREAKADGKPAVEPEKLLEFMADPNNPKDPEKAYKIMFEPELEEWKKGRINQAKKPSMITIDKSSAGAKTFEPKNIGNKDELRSALTSIMYGEGGAQ